MDIDVNKNTKKTIKVKGSQLQCGWQANVSLYSYSKTNSNTIRVHDTAEDKLNEKYSYGLHSKREYSNICLVQSIRSNSSFFFLSLHLGNG